MRTRCLSFHATYCCQHRGECCRAGWDIDVEPHIVEAIDDRRVMPLIATRVPFESRGDGAVSVARTQDGECGFHHADRCSLHAAGSESLLPSACRHFPRVYLRDARGALLTLSHFCPTAASLLMGEGPVTIVDAAPPLALGEPIEGLDARDALPPMVRPGMLADIEGYAAWEEAVIRVFLEAPDVETGLARVESATELVRRWRPSAGSLTSTVRDAFSRTSDASASRFATALTAVRELTGPHPLMEMPGEFEERWSDIRIGAAEQLRGPASRYMAACTFANWIAYRGRGLRSIVAWLHACHDVLRLQLVRRAGPDGALDPSAIVEAFRDTDYIMVHTVDSLAFGRAAALLEV